MLATIITEEQWLKLKSILLDLNVYDKPSLKETFLGIIYRLKTGCQWRYLPVIPPFLIELMGRKSKALLLFKNRWTTIY